MAKLVLGMTAKHLERIGAYLHSSDIVARDQAGHLNQWRLYTSSTNCYCRHTATSCRPFHEKLSFGLKDDLQVLSWPSLFRDLRPAFQREWAGTEEGFDAAA